LSSSSRLHPGFVTLSVLIASGCSAVGDSTPLGSDSIPVVEELRIGSLTGSEAYTFGLVGPVTPGTNGRVFIADIQVPIVRAYDADGKHIGDVGGRGQGPGEYLSIGAMTVLDDGRLLVWDEGNRRVNWFDQSGAHLDSRPLMSHGSYESFVIAGDGTIYTRVEGGRPRPADPIEVVGYWTRVTPDGETERLRPLALWEREGPSYVLSGRGGYYRPFTIMTIAAIGREGSYYEVRNDTYRIRHVHPDGRETSIIRDEPRVEVSPEELEEWQARSEHVAQRPDVDRATLFPIPETKPYVRAMLTDLDGRLWVSRYTEAVYVPYSESEAADRAEQGLPSYNWRDRLRWDVYAPDDTYLGAVTLPHNTSVATARGDELWTVQAGPFREDYVVRYRMGGVMATQSPD
jgi:hypothetical protein